MLDISEQAVTNPVVMARLILSWRGRASMLVSRRKIKGVSEETKLAVPTMPRSTSLTHHCPVNDIVS